jgi:hypothetical protein
VFRDGDVRSMGNMKTYPILRADGTVQAFEISSSWLTFRPIYKLLRSVRSVDNIKRNWFNEDRISFTFHGRLCVINEPWGDNSRFWIGPVAPEPELDVTRLHDAFRNYRRFFM